MATWTTIQQIVSSLPGVEEGTSWGTPAFRVRTRLLARLREDEETLVVSVGRQARAALLAEVNPTVFSEPHYDREGSRYVLVRLREIDDEALRELLTDAWVDIAPTRLAKSWLQEREAASGS
ncbi:MAG TPA: MmcQ/YjbR family DNA-binding protein [Thermomicrobiales bacterium]|jgi:hypothetical protein|nr:MmcQ/YjbR family DNA-binding protein [Thermomicrobiales bacterium]